MSREEFRHEYKTDEALRATIVRLSFERDTLAEELKRVRGVHSSLLKEFDRVQDTVQRLRSSIDEMEMLNTTLKRRVESLELDREPVQVL